MLDGILRLLADASGAIPAVVFVAATFFVLLTAVVAVALACTGERAERAVIVLRMLLRSRVPRE